MSEPVRNALHRLVAGDRPGPDAVTAALEAILRGDCDPALIAAFLTALSLRGEQTEDIVAGARVMRAHLRPAPAPEDVIDTCGTGGLSWVSLNTSTAAAFVAAGAGAMVAKHGNRSVPPKTGSADVLEALGVNLTPSDAQIEACFSAARLAFLFAPAHHAAMKHVGPVRRLLGIRTLFNLLGPLANPAGARRQLLGVYDPAWLEPYAKALRELGSRHAMVVHGLDGMDEISTSGPTRIVELRDGDLTTREMVPEDLGLTRSRIEDLRGGSASENAQALLAVLGGQSGPFADLVAVNAGAAVCLAGLARDLREGLHLARESISSGRAMAALEALKAASHG
ncbi:MAG: anthranilate phosphoribosyltransferase [Alphaproteobacteria bacterium]|nr:anthranilate phosphoribosyltransferase [Alphaproteobacteria bacterium]